MKIGTCGSLESNDCLITVIASEIQIIKIESIVYELFENQIRNVIKEIIKDNLYEVKVVDKGALDCTIRARLITALERMNKNA